MSNFRTFLSLCENKNSSLDLSYSHFALLHMVAVLPHVGVIIIGRWLQMQHKNPALPQGTRECSQTVFSA